LIVWSVAFRRLQRHRPFHGADPDAACFDWRDENLADFVGFAAAMIAAMAAST
jgi:hypothetical protein